MRVFCRKDVKLKTSIAKGQEKHQIIPETNAVTGTHPQKQERSTTVKQNLCGHFEDSTCKQRHAFGYLHEHSLGQYRVGAVG